MITAAFAALFVGAVFLEKEKEAFAIAAAGVAFHILIGG
jgi:hypothetical protein